MTRRAARLALLWFVIMLAAGLMASVGGMAAGDEPFELSASGTGASRSCTIKFRPSETEGDNSAPDLVMITNGMSNVTPALAHAESYRSAEIVQNNLRMPFPVTAETITVNDFAKSIVGKALASKQLFFVTASLADGRFVSSRYEAIDFERLLERIEANCSFDAESLMADVKARAGVEGSLALSSEDLKYIRWALNRQSRALGQPESRGPLSWQERTYLQRYAAESGLPVSRFLRRATADKLILEGRAIELKIQSDAEEVRYRLSNGDPDALQHYLDTCRVCAFRSQAREAIVDIKIGRASVFDNFDSAGGDLSHESATDLRDCLSRCALNKSCRAVTFDKWNMVCFLKSVQNTLWLDPHAVAAFLPPSGPPSYSKAPPQISSIPRRSFPRTAGTSFAESKEACEARCASAEWCVAETFFRSTRQCMLLRTTEQFSPDNDADSGVKKQSAEAEAKRQREELEFRSAIGNEIKLRAYLRNCKICEFGVQAAASISNMVGIRSESDSLVSFRICNMSDTDASAAISYYSSRDASWVIQGWQDVDVGACAVMGQFRRGDDVYYYVKGHYKNVQWAGDFNLCVVFPGPFRVMNRGQSCDYIRPFAHVVLESNWTINLR